MIKKIITKKTYKKESGAITLLVVITVFSFFVILVGAYLTVSALNKSQLKSSVKIKEIYEENVKEIDQRYNEIISVTEKDLPYTEFTNPYFPNNTFTKLSETDLNTGLVIKDNKGNEYVWVEVPTNIYKVAKSSTDYINIEKDMQTYVNEYRVSGYADAWYSNCGIATELEYNTLKNKMLKSVYENGGFWIGRYEAGTESPRTKAEDTLTEVKIKQDIYPYNFVTCEEAQERANTLNLNNYTSSLMFGIQWDLVLKHIETKGIKTKEELNMFSSEWGNYNTASFDIIRRNAKYSTDSSVSYISVSEKYTKPINTSVILTTGATERNKAMNIYDLSGNQWEWTLEKSNNNGIPCIYRGGDYSTNGYLYSSGTRSSHYINGNSNGIGFRISIYR